MSTYEVRVDPIPDGMAARALSLYGETMVQGSRRVRTADVTAVAGHCLTPTPAIPVPSRRARWPAPSSAAPSSPGLRGPQATVAR